ncbi:hypothetical protein SDJN03_23257, partial [Cucurbita argyrosperma subsp. sororia]
MSEDETKPEKQKKNSADKRVPEPPSIRRLREDFTMRILGIRYNVSYITAIDGAFSNQNLIAISEAAIIDGVHCISWKEP